jgi:hypothetical protein
MVRLQSVAIDRAREIQLPPPPGKPYSVPLPGSKVEGRTPVYRHWRFVDGLLETLDPKVSSGKKRDRRSGANTQQIRTAHEFFEDTGRNLDDVGNMRRMLTWGQSQQSAEEPLSRQASVGSED